MHNILDIIAKRQSKIKELQNGYKPNYFKVQEYLELDKYSTYIFITPRGIGKSHSQWELVSEVYEATGEYTVWMRTTQKEIDAIVADHKTNRPDAWLEHYDLRGQQLVDTRNGRLVCKFVALSTVGNLASIKGDGCFGIVYDEFLKRTGRNTTAGIYKPIADFIKTVERTSLLTVILSANLTTWNNEILSKWDLWEDKPTVDDEARRLRFRYIKEWDNPPKVNEISTAAMWADNDEELKAFMDNAEVLDNSLSLVVPESRLKGWRNLEMYMINDTILTLSMDDDNKFVIREGRHMEDSFVYDLTTEDSYQPTEGHIKPYDLKMLMSKVEYGLTNGNLLFTTHLGKELMFKFLVRLNGYLQKGNK